MREAMWWKITIFVKTLESRKFSYYERTFFEKSGESVHLLTFTEH